MRYVQTVSNHKGRTIYRFVPPPDAKLAGVVGSKEWTNREEAQRESKRLNLKVDKFREGEMKGKHINIDSPLPIVMDWWIRVADPPQFKVDAANNSRKHVGDLSLRDFCDQIHDIYEKWLEKYSASNANGMLNALSTMLDHCVSRGLIVSNPASIITRAPIARHHTVEHNPWTDEIADVIIDHCMQDVEKANIGIILLLMRSTLQGPGAITNLMWSDVDLTQEYAEFEVDDKVFTLSSALTDLLDQQHSRYGHQDYVVPRVKLGYPVVGPNKMLASDLRSITEELGFEPGLTPTSYIDFCVKQRVLGGDDPEHVRWLSGMSGERFNKLIDTDGKEMLQSP